MKKMKKKTCSTAAVVMKARAPSSRPNSESRHLNAPRYQCWILVHYVLIIGIIRPQPSPRLIDLKPLFPGQSWVSLHCQSHSEPGLLSGRGHGQLGAPENRLGLLPYCPLDIIIRLVKFSTFSCWQVKGGSNALKNAVFGYCMRKLGRVHLHHFRT